MSARVARLDAVDPRHFKATRIGNAKRERLYPIWVWRWSNRVNSGLLAAPFSSIDHARKFQALRSSGPHSTSFSVMNDLRQAIGVQTVIHMTFFIEAIKDDHRITDIRSSSIDAVILARKLAADGFAVSILSPTGAHYSADKFNLLLTAKNDGSQAAIEIEPRSDSRVLPRPGRGPNPWPR